jgi:hypothetical protein
MLFEIEQFEQLAKLFALQMHEHENEDCFHLYREAVRELEHIKMTGRIRDARVGIDAPIEALRHLPGLQGEETQLSSMP